MLFLESFDGSVLTQDPSDASRSAHEVVAESLVTVYPDSSTRKINTAISHADALIESALETPGETDDIGKLVLVGSALATALQGREGRFGRWKDNIVPKGQDPTLFWQTLVAEQVETSDENMLAKDDILFSHTVKDEPEALDLMASIIAKLSDENGLFEGMDPHVSHIHLLRLDDEGKQLLQTTLAKNGHKDNIGTSLYYRNEGVLLGDLVSDNLYADNGDGELAKGTLAHEVGHGFTTGLSNFTLFDRRMTAQVLSEMLAEHARLSLGYPSRSYVQERSLQYTANDEAGHNIIDEVIMTFRSNATSDKQAMLKDYAQRLVRLGGIIFGGLVLGAQPVNYLNDKNTTNESHDIVLLSPKNCASYRYVALSSYVPEKYRPSFAYNQSSHVRSRGVWEGPSVQEIALKKLFYELTPMRRRVFA